MSTMPSAAGVVVRNVYYMMAYAFKALDLEEYSRLSTEEFDGVEDLMAAILTIGIDLQRKRGLEREYMSTSGDIAGIRGRINARSTAMLRARSSALVTCEWDELSENTYKNRILKTVGGLLASSDLVGRDRRQALRRSLLALRDAGELNPRRIEWGRLRYHRNNASYQLLMNVCYMVVKSMLLSNDEGELRLAEFGDSQKLFALYERFVLEWFCKHHPELKPSARVIPRFINGDIPSFLPQLVTDVTLHGPNSTLIIDCKCYGKILNTHHGKEIATPGHLNQILSYVVHEGYTADNPVSGMLLYALTEKDAAREAHWNDIGYDFYLWTLDLGQEFSGISDSLERIAALVR